MTLEECYLNSHTVEFDWGKMKFEEKKNRYKNIYNIP